MNEQTGGVRRAVVIGAGFGGLALAIRLQRAGIQTTVLEKRDKPGGRAYVYHDQGFTFDAGPTVITDPPALDELFTGAGKRRRSLAAGHQAVSQSPYGTGTRRAPVCERRRRLQ